MDQKETMQKISYAEARRLLSEDGTTRDDHLTAFLSPGEVEAYELADGRILQVFLIPAHGVYEGGRFVPKSEPRLTEAWIYSSRADLILKWSEEEFEEEFDDTEDGRGVGVHVLSGSRVGLGTFESEVPRLASDAARVLGIDARRLDRTPESLKVVEGAVRRLGGRRCLEDDIFAPLVAYVGEVVREAVDGQWWLTRARDDDAIWEPHIMSATGCRVTELVQLWVWLYERPESPSIDELFSAVILRARMPQSR